MTETNTSIIDETEEKKGALGLSLTAGKWFVINIIIQKIFLIGTFFILARLLFPKDFGILAIALIVPNFLDLLSSISFDSTLIREKDSIHKYLDAIWTFGLIRSVVIGVAVFLSTPIIVSFFNLSGETTIVMWSGLILLISNLGNPGQLYFFKDLDFKKILWRDLSARIAFTAVSIALALIYHSYWALFLATAAQYLVGVIASYFLHPYRPHLTKHLGILKEIAPYSFWIYGQNIISQLASTVEDALVGKLTGAANFGLYGKAKGIAGGPITPLVSIINKIAFPAFAKIQDSKEKIIDGIIKSTDIMLLVALPFIAAIAVGGHRIVLLLLGTRWLAITPLLSGLATAFALSGIATIAVPLFNGIGLPKINFTIGTIYTVTFIATLALLIPPFGTMGAVWGMIASTFITAVITMIQIKRTLGMSMRKVWSSFFVVIISVAAVLPIGTALLQKQFFNSNIGFLSLISLLGVLYLALISLFGRWKMGPGETLLVVFRSIYPALGKTRQKSA